MKKLFVITIMFALFSCRAGSHNEKKVENNNYQTMKLDTTTLGAGCFWCVEAIFSELKGVISVTPGYAGGQKKNPTYKEVCEGTTGHAEVAQIVFDAEEISFDEILEVYWKTHDPTTLNRQGNDIGTQYRSVIFYHSDNQKSIAEKYKKELDASGAWDHPIVTEIEPIDTFYEAENYHHDYFSQHGDEQYCRYVIQPKVEKFKKVFSNKLK